MTVKWLNYLCNSCETPIDAYRLIPKKMGNGWIEWYCPKCRVLVITTYGKDHF